MACVCRQCGANACALLEDDFSLRGLIDNWVVYQAGADNLIKFKHLREMSKKPPHSPVTDVAQVFAIFAIMGLFFMILPSMMSMLTSIVPNQGVSPNIEEMQKKLTAILPYICGVGAFFCLVRGGYSVYSNFQYEQEYMRIMALRELISKLRDRANIFGACTYCKSLFPLEGSVGDKEELNPVNVRELFKDIEGTN